MQQAIDTFRLNIASVRQLDSIYQYLEKNDQNKTFDLSEILRAEIVLAVSAMDNFVSDLLLMGLVQHFERKAPLNSRFARFQVDMETLMQIINTPGHKEKSIVLGEYIRKFNERNSYQKPENIANSLQLLGITDLWNKLASQLATKNPADVKKELDNIVWQRDKIAREADFDHLTQRKRPRDRDSTLQAVGFIEKLCHAIYQIVTDSSAQAAS